MNRLGRASSQWAVGPILADLDVLFDLMSMSIIYNELDACEVRRSFRKSWIEP